jgi:hypothetical protein
LGQFRGTPPPRSVRPIQSGPSRARCTGHIPTAAERVSRPRFDRKWPAILFLCLGACLPSLHDSFVPQRFCQRHRLVPLTACVSGILRAMHGHSKQARPLLLIAPAPCGMHANRRSGLWSRPSSRSRRPTERAALGRTATPPRARMPSAQCRGALSVIVQWPLSWSQPFRSPRRSGVVS